MFCSKCGMEASEGEFCPKCGTPINQSGNGEATINTAAPYQQPQYQAPPVAPMYGQQLAGARCPNCGGASNSKYKPWQIVIAILLFPIGMLSLCAGKQHKCANCGMWFN